jgi:citrate lyase subunit beta/citryl-CoA lyase
MWSIHPNQIGRSSRPSRRRRPRSSRHRDHHRRAGRALGADQPPPSRRDTLHDRASYRYFWQVLERAHRTGQPLPAEVSLRFFDTN